MHRNAEKNFLKKIAKDWAVTKAPLFSFENVDAQLAILFFLH